MLIEEKKLRKIIVEMIKEVSREISEKMDKQPGAVDDDKPNKVGTETAEIKGVNTAKLAATYDIDKSKLDAAIKMSKEGNRNSAANAVLGDLFVNILNKSGDPEDLRVLSTILRQTKR